MSERHPDLHARSIAEDLEAQIRLAAGRWRVGQLLPQYWTRPLYEVCSEPHPAGWDGWHCHLSTGHIGRHASIAYRDGRYVVRAAWKTAPAGLRYLRQQLTVPSVRKFD